MKKEPCSKNGDIGFQNTELANRGGLLGNQCCNDLSLGEASCTLRDTQIQLLHRYLDGECSYLSRFSARRLLHKSSEARSYFNTLRTTAAKVIESTAMKAAALERESLSTNQMWDRIERRIEAEERASVLLGERNVYGKASPIGRATRATEKFGAIFDAISEMFVGRRRSVFGGMAAITTCCLLVVLSFSTSDVAYEIMPNSGEGDVNTERSQGGDEAGVSFVESSTNPSSETPSRNEIRILPFSRSLPIDFVSSRPRASRQGSTFGQGRHISRELLPWSSTQMSLENYASDPGEDYPLTAGTFDPFSFDDLIGTSHEGNSSEADATWGTSQSPQVAVSGTYHLGQGGVSNGPTIPNSAGNERGISSSVILQEQVIPKTNFASR